MEIEPALWENRQPEEILKLAWDNFQPHIVHAASFGLEDCILIHMAAKQGIPLRVITLDTGRLFQETYDVVQELIKKYACTIDFFCPQAEAVEKMVKEKGPNLMYDSKGNRLTCCFVRKVEPLRRALAGQRAWVTGLRRQQSKSRDTMQVLETDRGHGNIYKISPLINWTYEDCQDYINKHKVPYNKLFDKGFRSIGCAPCTRAVEEGEDERAGRWWWESDSDQECGIHKIDE